MNQAAGCDTIIELLAVEALEGLSGQLLQAVESHCAGCTDCAARRAGYRRVAELLVFSLPETPARPELRERLRLAIALRQRRRSRPWGRRAALAAGFAVAVALGAAGALLIREATTTTDAGGNDDTALQTAADARRFPLLALAPAGAARAEIVIDPDTGAALVYLSGLPALAGDTVYQFWFILSDDTTVSADVWRPEPGYDAVYLVTLPRPLAQVKGAWLTVEPAGGSPWPTGPDLFVGRFE